MRKLFIFLAILIIAFIVVIFLARNLIGKKAVTAGVKATTGLTLNMDSINVGILSTLIEINELTLLNPAAFPDPVMVDLPEIYIDYNLATFLKKKVWLEEVRLNLEEFFIIKNSKGELNIDSLKEIGGKEKIQTPKEESKPTKMLPVQIDILKLKIGKVVYKDYSKGEKPKVQTFNLNIDERFENITDPQLFARLMVMKALVRTNIANLANFDLGKLKKEFPESMEKSPGKAPKEVTKAGKETVKETTDALKNIIPFGK